MTKRKTAGELSLKCASDTAKYDSIEVGHSLTGDILEQLGQCIIKHNPIIQEDEYFIGYILASDCLIKNVMRRKFFALVHMPKPRPEQTVFLYSKKEQRILKRLWSLPDAKVMAALSHMHGSKVPLKVTNWKIWSDAFFFGWNYDKTTGSAVNTTPSHFFDVIRKQHGISHLSEKEYLEVHRSELIEACGNNIESVASDAFDFSEIMGHKVVDSQESLPNKDVLDNSGETHSFDRNIG
jgi:hypothetical protein